MFEKAVKTVRVTTREEVEAALGTADKIVAEGDADFLSYVIKRVSNDPEAEVVDVSIGPLAEAEEAAAAGASTKSQPDQSPWGPPREGSPWSPMAGGGVTTGAGPEMDELVRQAQESPRRYVPSAGGGSWLKWGLIIVASFVAGSAIWWLISLRAVPVSSFPTPSPATPAPSASGSVASITWAVVAIVAILALYLIARQAIAKGQNVEITWKVTEKVTGRVVITKAERKARRTRRASEV